MDATPNPTPFYLRVVDIEGSPGLILPEEVLAKLGVSEAGDTVDVVEDADGFVISRRDSSVSKQMDTARDVMAARRDALHELAKGPD